MLLWVCSITDLRRGQNVVGTSVTHLAASTPSVIYYFFNFIQFVTPHEHFVVSKKCTFFQNSRIPCCNNCFCSCNNFQVEEINQCFFFHLGVDLKKPIQMAYVPGHLYHMLFELLKVCSWHTVLNVTKFHLVE